MNLSEKKLLFVAQSNVATLSLLLWSNGRSLSASDQWLPQVRKEKYLKINGILLWQGIHSEQSMLLLVLAVSTIKGSML